MQAHSAGQGAGSEFLFRLPVVPGAATTSDGQPAAARQPVQIRRILVVDDNQDGATSLATLLKLEGYEVRTAFEGLSALEVGSRFLPHAMLVDILMPGMNGYELAHAIRDQPWGKPIILVAQTGYGEERDRENALRAGFDAHITKPFEYDLLAKVLTECAQKKIDRVNATPDQWAAV